MNLYKKPTFVPLTNIWIHRAMPLLLSLVGAVLIGFAFSDALSAILAGAFIGFAVSDVLTMVRKRSRMANLTGSGLPARLFITHAPERGLARDGARSRIFGCSCGAFRSLSHTGADDSEYADHVAIAELTDDVSDRGAWKEHSL